MTPIRIGALAPLTPPGWVEAGRALLVGLELGVEEVNADGGTGGQPLELVVRDTAADPARAVAAMEELARTDVVAVVGEYHSVVARAAAGAAERLRLPFLCSSAVLDSLVERPASMVARLAPAQSHAWRVYAEFLSDAGHRRLAVATQASAYWAAGVRILRDRLEPLGSAVEEIEMEGLTPAWLCDRVADLGATALLLLVGHPDPMIDLVKAVRSDERLLDVLVGAPAGQPELPDWAAALGAGGAAVPFLRYLPERLDPLGAKVETTLRERLGHTPSFVAFEGYDSIAVLAEVLASHGNERDRVAASWTAVSVTASRGTVTFSRQPGIGVWQWAWPPVRVVDRDPEAPDRLRVLR